MRARRRQAALVAAALAAACVLAGAARTRADAPNVATEVRAIASGGIARSYRAYHPASATARPALVMMLHGGFGTAQGSEDAYGWDAAAAQHGFVVVYPEGIGRSWNGGRCCGPARARNVDDVAFLTAVVRDAEQRDGVDPRRVYATGMSNGAIMAYRLACEAPLALAAIGPVAGDLEVACDAPHVQVSVLAIHGTADRNVPVGGGVGPKAFTRTEHASLAASLARWRAIDGCGPPASSRSGSVTAQTARCAGGTAVDSLVIEGAEHQWPGSKPPPAAAVRLLGLDQPSTALDATSALWEFFRAHVASDGGAS